MKNRSGRLYSRHMEFSIYNIDIEGLFVRTYKIYSEGNLLFQVKRKAWYSSKNYLFETEFGETIFRLYRPFTFFKYRFFIYDKDDIEIGEVNKEALSKQYELISKRGDYYLKGDFWSREFLIFKDAQEVAKVSRKAFQRKSNMGVAIKEGYDHMIILALVIMSDIVRQLQKQKSS